MTPATIPSGAHEWVSFPDPDEDRTWHFDITFLESSWTCIYGRGCLGVLTGPAPEREEGCCSYGAHFTGPEDRKRVEKAAAALTPKHWQFHDQALGPNGKLRVVERNEAGELVTRIHEDACIFLNRANWPGGAGCALHQAALAEGKKPLELKPDVCWQLPLRREDSEGPDGHITSVVSQWDRRHWGEGGREFHWWCTESPEAFVGSSPVHEQMRDEIVAMVGPKVARALRQYLRARAPNGRAPNGSVGAAASTVRVQHPAVRVKGAAGRVQQT